MITPLKLAAVSGASAFLLLGCTFALSQDATVARGKVIYDKECAACHGPTGEGGGAASLGLGLPPPDLVGLTGRNDGYFPREFVRRFILGLLEKEPGAAMPDFATVGLAHVYPNGGADGELLAADVEALLDYLESLQE